MKKYIIAIDQSTAGSKALLVNKEGKIIYKSSKKHNQIYPKRDYVEHNPIEIYENVISLLKELIEKNSLKGEEISSLSITNQRETVVVWDKVTGKPVHNAIVWQCRRTTKICEEIKDLGLEEKIKEKTGLVLDPYFSATKVKWILDNVEGAKEKVKKGELLLGTIESWLIWKLTYGKSHVSDYTNASRTMLLNINSLSWDKELMKIFNITQEMLPKLKNCDDIFGYTNIEGVVDVEIPICGVIGDSQGALFGQRAFEKGMVKATFGTGCSVLMNTGSQLMKSENGLVSALGWKTKDGANYALEGIIHSNGDTLNWLKDNLNMFSNFDEFQEGIESLDSNEGVYLVPAFLGLGYPYWSHNAKASIVGLSRSSDKRHIMRAALESIAYQINAVVREMSKESQIEIKELKGDGGATTNKFLMQFLCDLLDIKVIRSSVEELSAMGAVYLGGLGTGFWKSIDEIKKLDRGENEFLPKMDEANRKELCKGWDNAVESVLFMYKSN